MGCAGIKVSGEGLTSPALSLRPKNAVQSDYNHHPCEHGRQAGEPYCRDRDQYGRKAFAVIEHIRTTQAACFLGMHTHLLKSARGHQRLGRATGLPQFCFSSSLMEGNQTARYGRKGCPNSELA